jgi:pyruvate kinase
VEALDLKPGDRVEFTMGNAPAQIEISTKVNYEGLAGDVSAGDVMLVDNGVRANDFGSFARANARN